MYYILNSGQHITALYDDTVLAPPSNAVAISDADGERIRLSGDFSIAKLINGTLDFDDFGVAKKTKIAEIDAAYTAAIAVISANYPETERNSWAKQEAEARAWTANNTAVTPLLSAIATARGSTLADIAARVIANADAYAVYAGGVIGKRQAKMIAIAAATTIADLEAITW